MYIRLGSYQVICIYTSKQLSVNLFVNILLGSYQVILLFVHRYSVNIFSYSGPSGILGSDVKQNTTLGDISFKEKTICMNINYNDLTTIFRSVFAQNVHISGRKIYIYNFCL